MILIGGKTWRSQSFETNYTIIELVKKFKNNPNKVVGAISDAAYFLATNGLLNDCKHTVNNLAEIKDNENYTNSENFKRSDCIYMNPFPDWPVAWCGRSPLTLILLK